MSENIFGGARAEADTNMLNKAFVKTQNFEALKHTRDFNYVVGRRGTGKSALFIKLVEFIRKSEIGRVFSYSPKEYEQLSLKTDIEKLTGKYQDVRAITRVAWRVSMLIELLKELRGHYKYRQYKESKFLDEFYDKNEAYFSSSSFGRIREIVRNASSSAEEVLLIPGRIAEIFEVERLNNEVESLVNEIGLPHYIIFDGLDEGWSPEPVSTAILGGLALCASDFRERESEICLLMFFRDNIFRSLQYFDGDFSRHIEGSTLRLTWDEASLFQLITDRLRASLQLERIESDIKVWNRFSAGELKNLAGFRSCLNYTLFRPRDIIVLLNDTYVQINKSGRSQIVQSDIDLASKQISKNRLSDLLKEYKSVFPGLELLIMVFSNLGASQTYAEVTKRLDTAIETEGYEAIESSDFAIIETGKEAFFALYSVGFIGLERDNGQILHFCHDGSPAEIDAENSEQKCCVHPCYWKALNIQSEQLQEHVRIELFDDIKPASTKLFSDQRTKRIGQIVANLPQMSVGDEDAAKFETWVLNSVKMLFAGNITNSELHPNKDAIQRRDVVGTIATKDGFWGRIREDYQVTDVIFEVKNFNEMKLENYRQALSYSGKNYGKFVVIVNRSESEQLVKKEIAWVKEFWDQHDTLIFTLPAPFLARCISKLRTKARFDYVEDKLEKRLSNYRRSYLALRHVKTSKRKNPKESKQ